jgi:tetratricopeptide (TPR) repeat protein
MMKYRLKYFSNLLIFVLFAFAACTHKPSGSDRKSLSGEYSGSVSCRECHERFYKLWAPSHHGLAMQPITTQFILNEVRLDQEDIFMEDAYYKAVKKDTGLYIRERKGEDINEYQVLWAMGGKNVYYFLTSWEGGRLQTLPLAYDVHKKCWYNNPASAVRHFPSIHELETEDTALSWRDRQYTFNTSCYSCHVSQLKNNFNLEKNTYQTHWKEAGINCETCHGPSAEHVKVCREAGAGHVPDDLKIIRTSVFTPEQHNASCGSCHAKMRPITSSYLPGDRYFDNYDLITLENIDFFPDGRDLGENYTMTGWYMNPCRLSSDLNCITCHTSSGRYRFKSDELVDANKACISCHADKGEHDKKHTHHLIAEHSPKCIDCHMPMTRFGNMTRSDHSFRPPMPAATLKFGSPNACNICHKDKDAAWANRQVTQWAGKDYQKETLFIGSLVHEAREGKWNRLDEMLTAIRTNRYGEIFTTSLIRLLGNCNDPQKWPVLTESLKLPSPLSRSAAAAGLLGYREDEAKSALFHAARDEYRLVRLAVAQSLAVFPQQDFNAEQNSIFKQVNAEYENSLVTRPDDWSSYYNLGNHYQNRGQTDQALAAYENSIKIYPEAILPLVNSSFLYSVTGNQSKAELYLKRALTVDPSNEAANLNYGLLAAEMNRMDEAESALRKVMEVNKNNSTAAYNLSVIVSSRDLNESCKLSKQAMDASPDDPKFAYTYAYFLHENKKQVEATAQLEKTIQKFPDHLSSVFLLGSIYLESGNKGKAIHLYEATLKILQNNPQACSQLQHEIDRIRPL